MSANFSISPRDHGLPLWQGFLIHDALFGWLDFPAAERHDWPAKAV